MPLDFPDSPSTNDKYSAGGRTWTYNGTSWVLDVYVGVVNPGAIGTTELANNAVTTSKIADEAITEARIADSAVTNAKLASGAAASNLGFTPASTGKSIAMAIVFSG
jgi:hypothetical protein